MQKMLKEGIMSKKVFVALLEIGALSLAGVLASCQKEGNSTSSSGKTSLTIFMNGGNEYEGRKKDSIWKKIEEDTQVEMQIEGATHNSDYYTTLNPMINTGDIPDLIFAVPTSAGNAYNNWVNQDIVWNIDDLLAEKPGEYPYIETILHSDQFKNLTFGDGEHTLIPYLTSNSGWGIYYRTDWLINVGYYTEVDGVKTAKTPSTIEEFQEVLRLFTENDPDKNGKADTYGLSPFGKAFYQNPLYHAFGVTPDYDIDSTGQAEYMLLSPEYKKYLAWINTMYAKGYIDPQFATNNNSQDRDKFYEGKTGILITNAEQHVSWIASAFENANGKGLLTMGPAPVGTKNLGVEGKGGFSDWGGYWGGYSISRTCADPYAALRLMNYLYSPEGSKLRTYGIEGVHYSVVDEKYVPNIDNRNAEPTGAFSGTNSADGTFEPTGFYKFGNAFSNDIDWSEDRAHFSVHIDPDAIDSKYSSLIKQGIAYNTLCTSKLVNVTGFYSSFTTKMKKVEDAANTYAINAIMGKKNLESDYEALFATISQSTYDWPNIQKMIIEVAKKGGIIS
jgi:ABC-type glycerol-3-phosphate transport system substrate-binding protein